LGISQCRKGQSDRIGLFHVEPDSPGKRLYLIRLALGDGMRRPEPMAAFVARVREATGESYDTGAVSLLERDLQGWRLKDMNAFAAVDPLKRGGAWLGFGVLPLTAKVAESSPDYQATAVDFAAARAQVVEEERRQAARKPAKRRGRGRRG
jgi:hypothetical protein